MRKEYVKPSMRLVDWNFQNPVCDTVYQNSPCIVVGDNTGGNTRHDHIHSYTDGELGDWNVTPTNNGRWN